MNDDSFTLETNTISDVDLFDRLISACYRGSFFYFLAVQAKLLERNLLVRQGLSNTFSFSRQFLNSIPPGMERALKNTIRKLIMENHNSLLFLHYWYFYQNPTIEMFLVDIALDPLFITNILHQDLYSRKHRKEILLYMFDRFYTPKKYNVLLEKLQHSDPTQVVFDRSVFVVQTIVNNDDDDEMVMKKRPAYVSRVTSYNTAYSNQLHGDSWHAVRYAQQFERLTFPTQNKSLHFKKLENGYRNIVFDENTSVDALRVFSKIFAPLVQMSSNVTCENKERVCVLVGESCRPLLMEWFFDQFVDYYSTTSTITISFVCVIIKTFGKGHSRNNHVSRQVGKSSSPWAFESWMTSQNKNPSRLHVALYTLLYCQFHEFGDIIQQRSQKTMQMSLFLFWIGVFPNRHQLVYIWKNPTGRLRHRSVFLEMVAWFCPDALAAFSDPAFDSFALSLSSETTMNVDRTEVYHYLGNSLYRKSFLRNLILWARLHNMIIEMCSVKSIVYELQRYGTSSSELSSQQRHWMGLIPPKENILLDPRSYVTFNAIVHRQQQVDFLNMVNQIELLPTFCSPTKSFEDEFSTKTTEDVYQLKYVVMPHGKPLYEIDQMMHQSIAMICARQEQEMNADVDENEARL